MGGLALASLCVNALFLSRRRVEGMGGRLGLRRRLASQGMVWSGLVTLSNIRKGKDPLDS